MLCSGRLAAIVVSVLLACCVESAVDADSGADNSATRLTLTRDGVPTSAIVLGTTPTLSAQFAAAELQYHIEKITGAKLPIVNEDAEVKGVRILIGDSKYAWDLGMRSEDFASQEYAIAFRPNTVVLIGKDASLEDTAKYRNRVALNYADFLTFPIHFEENGSVYAVYDFLEKYCDVRWYTATDLGMCLTKTPTLSVGGSDVRRSPYMEYRCLTMNPFPSDLMGDTVKGSERMQPLEGREMRLFELRQRLGGEPYDCGHSFYGYYDRFLKDHPEWFAQGYEGQPPQMCYTNPDFIKQVVADARDFFDGRQPHKGASAAGRYFGLGPMDNDMWCKCANCRALILDKPTRGIGSLFNADQSSSYWFQFVNKVAREVRKSHPDKRIATIAYMGYAYPPLEEPLEPNVLIQMTLSSCQPYRISRQRTDEEEVRAWVEESVDRPKYVWLWYCFPTLLVSQMNTRCAMPGFFADFIPQRIKEYVDAGVKGISLEPSYIQDNLRSALFDQLEIYLTFKLADDPTLDGGKIIEEFFERYYGPSARPMRSFYRIVERMWTAPRSQDNFWRQYIDDETMGELELLMQQARDASGDGIEKQRVDLFDKGVWQYMKSARKTFAEQDAIKALPIQSVTLPNVATGAFSGDPERVDWSAAALLQGWSKIDGGPGRAIEAQAMHDASFLYIRLLDPVDSGTLTNDGGIWGGDDWELFFARERKEPYRQIGINPEGKSMSLAYGEGSNVWESGAVVTSSAGAGKPWDVRVALPLNNLLPGGFKPGETFFMNMIRAIPGAEAAAWIPTFSGFHELGRLGEIRLEP